MKFYTYMLSSLNCPDCAARLEKAISRVPGVQEAKVSFATGALSVKVDETTFEEQKLKDTVKNFSLEITAVLPGRE
jgi:Cd2+/Zn2+-exporting ATPase